MLCLVLGIVAFGGNYFDRGEGAIWLDKVDCVGTEKNLTECQYLGNGVRHCSHNEDAGVRCALAEENICFNHTCLNSGIIGEHIKLANILAYNHTSLHHLDLLSFGEEIYDDTVNSFSDGPIWLSVPIVFFGCLNLHFT